MEFPPQRVHCLTAMLPIALGVGTASVAGFSLRYMDKPTVIDSPLH